MLVKPLNSPGCRLSDHDAGLGEDDAATLGDVTGRGDRVGSPPPPLADDSPPPAGGVRRRGGRRTSRLAEAARLIVVPAACGQDRGGDSGDHCSTQQGAPAWCRLGLPRSANGVLSGMATPRRLGGSCRAREAAVDPSCQIGTNNVSLSRSTFGRETVAAGAGQPPSQTISWRDETG